MRKSILIAMLVALALTAAALAFSHGGADEPYFKISALSLEREWIQIRNVDTRDRSIGNWMVLSVGSDGSIDQLFRFPFSCVVKAGGIVTIYSGDHARSPENRNDRCWQEDIKLYWDWSGSGPQVWRDKGDTACLIDYDRRLVDEHSVRAQAKCLEQY